MKDSLLRFSIGPVQGYIKSARSVRDLWTGSYLLSWLTAAAVAEVMRRGGAPLHPHLADSPLVRVHRGEANSTAGGESLRSCLPNLFFATVPVEAGNVCGAVEGAVRAEWKRLTEAVRGRLAEAVGRRERQWLASWDAGWDRQVDHLWDLRVNQMGPLPDWRATARALGLGRLAEVETDPVLGHLGLLERAAAAGKLVRHIRPSAPAEDTRPKCMQTGEDEQMGLPGNTSIKERQAFWDAMAQDAIGGEWLRERDKFGAPALVKRFAWAHGIAPSLGRRVDALRNADTATIAAAGWAEKARQAGIALPESLVTWSAEEEQGMTRQIRAAQRQLEEAPAVYYAVLMMDGDEIGKRVRQCSLEEQRLLARLLHDFSLKTVPALIDEYLGGNGPNALNQPVYAGGDDVLALLPMMFPRRDGGGIDTVLELGHRIVDAFGRLGLPGDGVATMSAGLAIVHAKTDLREALDAARAAEKQAKLAGRNRLAIAACRRSGEHSTAVLRWDGVPVMAELVRAFATTDASDRWAYQLRMEMESLPVADAVDAELARLLARADRTQAHDFHGAWMNLLAVGPAAKDAGKGMEARRNALALIQTASFMARAREEDR